MIILLVSSMTAMGGTERSTQTLSELLTGRGHEVHLLGPRGPLCADIEALGVKYFDVETHSKGLIDNLALLKSLAHLLKRYRYDCVHLQMARPIPIAVMANIVAGSPAKIIWHSRGIRAKTYQYVPRLFSAMGVRAIGNCKDEQDKLVRYGFRKDRVGFVYNPCRLERISGSRSKFREEHGFSDRDVVIGSLSRLHIDRGVNYSIEYFNRLCNDHSELGPFHFVIAGDGEDRENLEQQAAESANADKITFLGAIEDIQNFYTGIDLFWNPVAFRGDQSAGTGNTLIEAGFQKVASVSHDWGGVSEIIIDGVTGGLSKIGEEAIFVKKTVELLSNDRYRKNTIERAFSHVTKLVSSAACVKKVEHYYQTL